MALREKRFTLANQMRFTQDTLLQHRLTSDTTRLKNNLEKMNKEKVLLLQKSLMLADSIRIVMDGIMKDELKDEKDKTQFNEMLNAILKQKGCLDKEAN